jgi:hypothetical protein
LPTGVTRPFARRYNIGEQSGSRSGDADIAERSRSFPEAGQIGLRVDLPIIWNNKPLSENRLGAQSGLGDLLFQAIYAHTFKIGYFF